MKESKEMKIIPPEGYEIDKSKSTFDKIIFREVKFPSLEGDLEPNKVYWCNNSSYTKGFIIRFNGDEEDKMIHGNILYLDYKDYRTNHRINYTVFPTLRKATKEEINFFEKCEVAGKYVNKLPKKWGEITDLGGEGYYISSASKVTELIEPSTALDNKNLLPTELQAKAVLALTQLIRYRDIYNDGWKPDLEKNDLYDYIILQTGNWIYNSSYYDNHLFYFKTELLAKEFLNNFKDNLLKDLKELYK